MIDHSFSHLTPYMTLIKAHNIPDAFRAHALILVVYLGGIILSFCEKWKEMEGKKRQ